MSSNNTKVINIKAKELVKMNNKRKQIEKIIINEINFKKIEEENKEVIVYYNPNVNEGLIGIIAARLKDYFNKPSFVITNSNSILKGSARSIEEIDIGKILLNLKQKNILIKGGGHAMAGGFSSLKKIH